MKGARAERRSHHRIPDRFRPLPLRQIVPCVLSISRYGSFELPFPVDRCPFGIAMPAEQFATSFRGNIGAIKIGRIGFGSRAIEPPSQESRRKTIGNFSIFCHPGGEEVFHNGKAALTTNEPRCKEAACGMGWRCSGPDVPEPGNTLRALPFRNSAGRNMRTATGHVDGRARRAARRGPAQRLCGPRTLAGPHDRTRQDEIARHRGRRTRDRPRPRPQGDAPSAEKKMHGALVSLGFQPEREVDPTGTLNYKLCNCPYRDVVRENQPVVCTLHRGMTRGLLTPFLPRRGSSASSRVTPTPPAVSSSCAASWRTKRSRRPQRRGSPTSHDNAACREHGGARRDPRRACHARWLGPNLRTMRRDPPSSRFRTTTTWRSTSPARSHARQPRRQATVAQCSWSTGTSTAASIFGSRKKSCYPRSAPRDPHHPLVAQALCDHVDIRARADALMLDAKGDPAILHELGTRLADHVRLEERQLFRLIEAALPTTRLATVATALEHAEGCAESAQGV